MAEEKKEAPEAPKKKMDLRKFADLGFAVLNLCVLGGGAFLTYQNTIAYHPPSLREPAALESLKKEKAELEKQINGPIIFKMEPFNVNLAGSPQKVIRVEMSFEMLDQDGFEEVVHNVSRERDMVVALLNKKFVEVNVFHEPRFERSINLAGNFVFQVQLSLKALDF